MLCERNVILCKVYGTKREENKQPKSFPGVAALASAGSALWLSFNPCLEQVQSLMRKPENQSLLSRARRVTLVYASLPFQPKTFSLYLQCRQLAGALSFKLSN